MFTLPRERRNRGLKAFLAAALLTLAQGSLAGPVTTSLIIPLRGEALAGSDVVSLAGRVHVVTHVTFGDDSTTVDVAANLANVKGVGDPSGDRYGGTGAATSSVLIPDGPPGLPPLSFGFVLKPEGPPGQPPDPVFPLPVTLTLIFGETGKLVEASAQVGVP